MIVEGKKISNLIENQIKKTIEEQNLQKSLAIFYVGNNSVIDGFIKLKKNFGERVGVRVRIFHYEKDITTKSLIKEIKDISKDFDGVVVQLPLPEHIDREKVLDSVPVDKDIDVLGSKKYKNFLSGDLTFFPPVAGAIFEVLNFHNVSLDGKKIVVVGDGMLVGRPVFDWLKIAGLKPKKVTEKTKNKNEIYKNSDVIITGVGKSETITLKMIKKGVVLIDAGTSIESDVVVGDISKDSASKASLFSTVPGGVGPITVAILFRNLLYT